MRGRWPPRAGPEAARAARGGGERDAGLRGKREGGSRAGLLATGELGQSGLDRRWALAGKGRKVGPDWAEHGIGLRGKGMEEKGWAASGFGGLTGLGLVSGFSPFPSLFFSNTLKLI